MLIEISNKKLQDTPSDAKIVFVINKNLFHRWNEDKEELDLRQTDSELLIGVKNERRSFPLAKHLQGKNTVMNSGEDWWPENTVSSIQIYTDA